MAKPLVGPALCGGVTTKSFGIGSRGKGGTRLSSVGSAPTPDGREPTGLGGGIVSVDRGEGSSRPPRLDGDADPFSPLDA